MSKLGSNSPLAGLLGLGSLAGANPGGGVNPHAGNTADGRWQCWQEPFVGVFVLVLGESCQRDCLCTVCVVLDGSGSVYFSTVLCHRQLEKSQSVLASLFVNVQV